MATHMAQRSIMLPKHSMYCTGVHRSVRNEHPAAMLHKQGAPVVLPGGQFPLPAASTSSQPTLRRNPGQVFFLLDGLNTPPSDPCELSNVESSEAQPLTPT